ncbi:hypothetical protein TKK_0018810 [Trichogramma kaykai]|uniref:Mitochondrial proton/calcium exchanger protein n=1 Tax=Trichogramma kaykai TaxID=54128 RepID=A0ABD2VVS1_9HYME
MYPIFNSKSITVFPSTTIKGCYLKKRIPDIDALSSCLTLIYKNTIVSKPVIKIHRPILVYHSEVSNFQIRFIHIQTKKFGSEASSKVEETVKNIKEENNEQKSSKLLNIIHAKKKKMIRLLGLDMKVAAKLCWRMLQGHELNRREHRLLVKTTGDTFRLIPFSVFIIVPFMEFLLPIAIKIFPGLLPSTFQTATEKEDKLKRALKVKVEMAKFLQKTLDEMALQSTEHGSKKAKEFVEFFYKIRSTGSIATNEEIMKFSKLFEDEITLDSLSRQQLIALCRVLDVQTLGTTNFLRFLLRMKLRSLAADDRMIEKEGINSLTRTELQQACRARGMRAYGMSEQKLKEQLMQWLDLSLNKKVPPTLLLLSRALMVPDTVPMTDKLKATISALPDTVITRTKGAIVEKEGKVDYKTNIEIIKMEEKKIEEEREEEKTLKISDKHVQASNIYSPFLKKNEITTNDVKVLEQALETLSTGRKEMPVVEEELKELKEEMAEYQEDVKELNQLKKEAKGLPSIDNIKITKGAKHLFIQVNRIISKLDNVVSDLKESEKQIKITMDGKLENEKLSSAAELFKVDELIAAIKKIQSVPDEHRLARITEILGKIDEDQDGAIKISDILKVIELIGKEDIKLSGKQLEELMELMVKEEILEVEDQIQKTLEKEKNENKEDNNPDDMQNLFLSDDTSSLQSSIEKDNFETQQINQSQKLKKDVGSNLQPLSKNTK